MNQRNVPCYVLESIKDEPALVNTLGPVDTSYISQLLSNCPFVFAISPDNPNGNIALPFTDPALDTEPSLPQLRQISPHHRRSFEVSDANLPHVWYDDFGNPYTSLSLKGNNFSETRLIETATAPNGFIAFGLQESNIIERVLTGSRILRAAGITTEWIMGVAEPSIFAQANEQGGETDWHDFCSLPQYKQHLAHHTWSKLEDDERTLEKYLEYQQKMKRLTYYVSARAMDTSIRLWELENIPLRKEVFDVYARLNPNERSFDHTKEEDLLDFLEQVTLPNLATNMRKAHDCGVAFRFPNNLNTTALGSIVDLDSLHGEPLGLGDDAITDSDKLNDILQVLEGVCNVVERQHAVNIRTASLIPSEKEKRMTDAFLSCYLDNSDTDFLQTMHQLIIREVVTVERILLTDFLKNMLLSAGISLDDNDAEDAHNKQVLDMDQPLSLAEIMNYVDTLVLDVDSRIYQTIVDITYFYSSALSNSMTRAMNTHSASVADILLDEQSDFWHEPEPKKLLEFFGLLYATKYTNTAFYMASLDPETPNYDAVLSIGHAVVRKLINESNQEWLNIFCIDPSSFSIFNSGGMLDNSDTVLHQDLIDTVEGLGVYTYTNLPVENLGNALFNNSGSISCLTIKNSIPISEQCHYADEQVAYFTAVTNGGYFREFVTDGDISLTMASTNNGAPTYEFCLNNEANYIAGIEMTTEGKLEVTILVLNGVLPKEYMKTDSDEIMHDILLISTLVNTRKEPKKNYSTHLLYRQLELFRDVSGEQVFHIGFLATNSGF